jgi:predicted RNase H-like HicB family nuclease
MRSRVGWDCSHVEPAEPGSGRPDIDFEGQDVEQVRYTIVISWSEEDHKFLAEVSELPGCAADGVSYQEAVANAEVVIREWIETAQELGRPIPNREAA